MSLSLYFLLGTRSETANQINTCTTDFKYYVHADDSKIPKLQKFLFACWMSSSAGLRLGMC